MEVSATGIVVFACVIVVIILFVVSRRKEGRSDTDVDVAKVFFGDKGDCRSGVTS